MRVVGGSNTMHSQFCSTLQEEEQPSPDARPPSSHPSEPMPKQKCIPKKKVGVGTFENPVPTQRVDGPDFISAYHHSTRSLGRVSTGSRKALDRIRSCVFFFELLHVSGTGSESMNADPVREWIPGVEMRTGVV